MIEFMLVTAITLYCISVLLALYRVVRGPSIPDRIVAMDMIGVNVISIIAAISVLFRTMAFLEAILIIGLFAFISTIALTRFLERGVIIERKRRD